MKYLVSIKGENFRLDLDEFPELVEFEVDLTIVAEDEESAEIFALEAVRNSPKLQKLMLTEEAKKPIIQVIDITRRPWWARQTKDLEFNFSNASR
ncbi:hypothetical protein [Neiella marina]|uniref:hypothetical protein n=1 Tax=Neiella marina TaxID=508461 RepID=UPI00117E6D0E|nr:hypothetical protein [Neiella marina]